MEWLVTSKIWILLALAMGVMVALWLKQRKR